MKYIFKIAVHKSLKRCSSIIPDYVYHRTLGKGKIIGLNYHVVSDVPVKHVRHLFKYKSTYEFERDIIYLKNTYKLLTYDELIFAKENNNPYPYTSVVLSFDDGLSECYSVVRPILLRHKIPCIFFISTDFIDNKNMCFDNILSLCIDYLLEYPHWKQRDIIFKLNEYYGTRLLNTEELIAWMKTFDYTKPDLTEQLCALLGVDIDGYLHENKPYLSESEIKQLAQDGFTVGAHSRRHFKLTACTEKEMETEIIESCEIIGGMTGLSEIPFAFPYNSTETIDRNYLERMRENNKVVGLLFHGGGFRTDRNFMIGRVTADTPPGKGNGTSTVPRLMNKAYQKEYRRKINQIVKLPEKI